MVTGCGDMTSNSSLKSLRCMGNNLFSAVWRSSSVSATIISITTGSLSMSLNMRSVRQRPMPLAPYFSARRPSAALSPLAMTIIRAASSAQCSNMLSSVVNSASTVAISPRYRRPVVPSRVIMSPSWMVVSPTKA